MRKAERKAEKGTEGRQGCRDRKTDTETEEDDGRREMEG